MKDIEKLLRDTQAQQLGKLGFGDKQRLYDLYGAADRTATRSLTRTFYIIAAAAAVTAVMLSVSANAGNTSLRELVKAKTDDLPITDDKRAEMAERIAAWEITPEEFESHSFEIGANSYGETYGSLFDGVDLIAVGGCDNDEDITGYVYLSDYSCMLFNSVCADFGITTSNREHYLHDLEWVYVYDCEGTQILGKYMNSGFKTNAQLEQPDTKAQFTCGNADSVAKYEAIAESRTEDKLAAGLAVEERSVTELDEKYGYSSTLTSPISCYGTDGVLVTGYVYKEDMAWLNNNTKGNGIDERSLEIQDAAANGRLRNWIYVYAEDKTTVIGKYVIDYAASGIITRPNEELEEFFEEHDCELAGFRYGFMTNDQLDTLASKKYIIDGTDIDEYTETAQQRSAK